jgi:deoxyhypusine synthase
VVGKQGLDYEALMASLKTTGFQATSFGQAVDEVNRMVPVPPAQPTLFVLLGGGRVARRRRRTHAV